MQNYKYVWFCLMMYSICVIFFKLGFTPCKAEQSLRDMELQEKEAKKIEAPRKSV